MADGSFYSTISDASGYYSLFVPDGCYEVSMNPAGAAPNVSFQPTDFIHPASAHEGGSHYDYELYSGAVISLTGGIQDYYSTPVDGDVFYRNDALGIYYETASSGYGEFTLTNLPEGEGRYRGPPLG